MVHKTIITLLFLTVLSVHGQKSRTDSLKYKLLVLSQKPDSRENDSLKGEYTFQLAELVKKNDPKLAIAYQQEAVAHFTKARNFKRASNSILSLASLNRIAGDFEKAEKFCRLAIDVGKATRDSGIIAAAYNNLGNVYLFQAKYKDALKYHFESLKLKEVLNKKKDVADSYNNIGNIYYKLGDLQKAAVYFEKSLKLKMEFGEGFALRDAYTNLAVVYDMLGNFEQGYLYHMKLVQFFTNTNDLESLAREFNNIGGHFYLRKNADSCHAYQVKALKIYEKTNDKNMLAACYINFAHSELTAKDFGKADEYYRKADAIAAELKSPDRLQSTKGGLARTSYMLKRYKEAYDYLNDYYTLKDSIEKESNNMEMGKLEAKMEYDKKNLLSDLNHKKEIEKQKALAAADSWQKNIVLGFIIAGLFIVGVFAVLMFKRYRITRRQKSIIEQQKKEVEAQKSLVDVKQKEIIDSINYAKRLQAAILSNEENILEIFPNSFLLYKPKDIVAGDFYFFETTATHVFYAAADCTGHGVPGAMVSVVCSNALTRCVKEFNLTDPGKILDQARELVLATFKKSGKDVKDGMDISLLVKDLKNNSYSWAGANNSLWMTRDKALIEVKADKQPIGQTENPKPFRSHPLLLKNNDNVYLFTDGYADQFGGQAGKKLKYKEFGKLVTELSQKDMKDQKTIIDKKFEEWKGALEQVDDVCIIGIKI